MKIKMTFEIGNGYGYYCELDNSAHLDSRKRFFEEPRSVNVLVRESPKSISSTISISLDIDADEMPKDINCMHNKNKTNRQLLFLAGVYFITIVVIIAEYIVFFVAKR
jgi:hypothetical protein